LLRAIRSDPSLRPDALPTGVAFVPSSNSVKVIYGQGQAAQQAVLRAEQVATLLVSHCMRIGVPVPRHAGKEVQVLDDHVCLSFSTSIDPVPLDPRPLPRSTKATGSRSWFPEEHFPCFGDHEGVLSWR
jgi:hypothetical protein